MIEISPKRRGKITPQFNTEAPTIPVSEIIAAKDNSGLAQGIGSIGDSLAEAIKRRYELRQSALQTKKIESTLGLPDGSLGGLPPTQAMAVGGKIYEQQSKKPKVEMPFSVNANGQMVDPFSNQIITKREPDVNYTQINKPNQDFLDLKKDSYDLRKDAAITAVINNFNADPSVKKSQQSVDASNTIRDLAVSGNPIAAAAIPTYSARMSGEVGNLSEADKRPFGGSRAILARIDQALTQAATGGISNDNKQFVLNLTDIIQKRAQENIGSLAKKRAQQHRSAYGLNENDWYEKFYPTDQRPQAPPTFPGATGKTQKIGRFEVTVEP